MSPLWKKHLRLTPSPSHSLPSLSVVQSVVVSVLWLSVLLPCNLDLRANGVQWSLCAQPPGGGDMGKVDWKRNQRVHTLYTRLCELSVGGCMCAVLGVWVVGCGEVRCMHTLPVSLPWVFHVELVHSWSVCPRRGVGNAR